MQADFRVTTWLNGLSPYAAPIGGAGGVVPKDTGMTNLQVLALLIARNGFRPKVTGWGAPTFKGPFGLTQTDAFLLMELGPYFQGLIDGGGLSGIATAQAYLEPELLRLADEFEKAGAEESAQAEKAAHTGEGAAPAEGASDALASDGGDESVVA